MADKKPTGNTYEIKTVADLMQLTPRQREHAAKDFLLWVRYVNAMEAVSEYSGGGFSVTTDAHVFRWIDDGEHIATMNFKDPHGNAVGTFQRDHGEEFRDSNGDSE